MDPKNLLRSIHFETCLLEALEWDEDKLNDVQLKLSEYFSVTEKKDLDLILVDLGYIFSEPIPEIVYTYLKDMQSLLIKREGKR